MLDNERLHRAYLTARDDLSAQRVPEGHWVGELSSSALSTATATSALASVLRYADPPPKQRETMERLVRAGVQWLASHNNADGGWGDTDKSFSNIATTMLACAAFHLAGAAEEHRGGVDRGAEYVERAGGVPGIRRRYGKDKTFSVPILTNAALAGLVDWSEVAPLPYELACLPQAVWGMLRMPVVSYATPALVAIGQARFHHRPPRNPVVRWLRRWVVPKTLAILERMQPSSGGFLEATPLTSFVVMSLAASGGVAHPVTRGGVEFLIRSVRPDGSWPIDTNLATWTTTLATSALASAGEDVSGLVSLDWLIGCQHQGRHPMTGTAAGGWGWTNFSGAVPDADDTSAALLALATLRRSCSSEDARRIDQSAAAGLQWLLALQNADGGWPTFCRGWGTMPFDRSGVDLTAHAIRAIHAWHSSRTGLQTRPGRLWRAILRRARSAIRRGLRYLERQQRADGSWVALWFGNQHHPDEENPIYGTARVLLAYRDLGQMGAEPARRGLAWLAAQCDAEGGWGARLGATDRTPAVSSVEETAIAVEALLAASEVPCRQETARLRGIDWLIRAVETGKHRLASPIGLYFARLWYYERLYPVIFTVSALGRAVRRGPPET
jgi:squalene-hopene/tetraprenyl-beta-curcumene cyclase